VNYQTKDLHVFIQMTVKQSINSQYSSAVASVKPGQTYQNPDILETWSGIDGF
jgi:hypothetical protein